MHDIEKPTAARIVEPGDNWAFTEHRTLAEIVDIALGPVVPGNRFSVLIETDPRSPLWPGRIIILDRADSRICTIYPNSDWGLYQAEADTLKLNAILA